MTATAHALAGAVIVSQIHNPAISLPLAFGSHFLMDFIPHWDVITNGKNKSKARLVSEAVIDLTIGIALSYFFFGKFVNWQLLGAGILAAQLLDWLEVPYFLFDVKPFPLNYILDLHLKFHNRKDKPWGIIFQIIFVTALIILTVNFAHLLG